MKNFLYLLISLILLSTNVYADGPSNASADRAQRARKHACKHHERHTRAMARPYKVKVHHGLNAPSPQLPAEEQAAPSHWRQQLTVPRGWPVEDRD